MVEGRTAVRPGGALNFVVFRVAFRLPVVFALLLPYNAHVPGHLRHPIHTQDTPICILSSS